MKTGDILDFQNDCKNYGIVRIRKISKSGFLGCIAWEVDTQDAVTNATRSMWTVGILDSFIKSGSCILKQDLS